jgi:translation initiation factor 1|tara:strand:- start:618 stop:992 length:375 start_codon:yes stop_codon:yes gene_type:complete
MRIKKDKSNMSNLVFSSDERICRGCLRPRVTCVCKSQHTTLTEQADGIVRLHRETKGRKGKGVTLVKGLILAEAELSQLAKKLKNAFGVGGSIRAGVIELQTVDRDRVKELLEEMGHTVKLAGS